MSEPTNRGDPQVEHFCAEAFCDLGQRAVAHTAPQDIHKIIYLAFDGRIWHNVLPVMGKCDETAGWFF
ncbi:MAG: hypothetical protein ACK4Q5_00420 [Saprospiraceae bacterium]